MQQAAAAAAAVVVTAAAWCDRVLILRAPSVQSARCWRPFRPPRLDGPRDGSSSELNEDGDRTARATIDQAALVVWFRGGVVRVSRAVAEVELVATVFCDQLNEVRGQARAASRCWPLQQLAAAQGRQPGGSEPRVRPHPPTVTCCEISGLWGWISG